MISVIIPLMPIEPYKTQLLTCIDSLNAQDTDVDINVMEQPIEDYIHYNTLMNAGVRQAKGDYLYFCGADFIFGDKTALRRMQEEIDTSNVDVIFTMFLSQAYKQLKMADGGVFTTKKVMEIYGDLDESLIGISWVTFPFLAWCLDNINWHCSDRFVVAVDQKHSVRKKRHWKTSGKIRPLYKETVKTLQEAGVWP